MSEKEILNLSRMGIRGAFGQMMQQEARQNPDLMVITADLGITAGLKRYIENMPEQYLNVGIAEQNMINVAAGFSLKGYKTMAVSFAPFVTARCCEQIKVHMGEAKLPIILVGIASGFEMEYFGNSHYGFDDKAIMRPISEITILCPADTTELQSILLALRNYPGAVYLRLTKMERKGLVYKKPLEGYEIGKAIWHKEAGEITIIASGSMLATALEVARKIEERNISCGVLDMHTVKPLDKEAVREACKKGNLIITLEEHSIYGGLGSSVAEVKAELADAPPQLIIGISDRHCHVGNYDFLIKEYGLDEESVLKKILQKYKEDTE